MSAALDPFIPHPDVRERHVTTVRAPARLVFDVACGFDLQSIPLVRAIFRLRERLMGIEGVPRQPRGFIKESRELGWGCLIDQPGELFAAGAVCQPWRANVTFTPVPADRFAEFAEPDQVKIVWTLEAEPLGPELTRFATETRAVATDAQARAKFRRYWRWARFGVVPIRWLLLAGVRRRAEARWAP
jgi:hypothetical protein